MLLAGAVLMATLPLSLGCTSTGVATTHFGAPDPGTGPAPFEPGFLPSPGTVMHSAPAFSSDGKTVFFSAYLAAETPRLDRVLFSRWDGDGWASPVTAPFSGEYDDNWPWFPPDGDRLYFSSRRPSAPGDSPAAEYGLWYVEREADGWTEPRQVTTPSDLGPDQGTIHVAANLPGGHGDLDIYRIEFRDGAYRMPENLGPAVNTPSEEYGPCVASDGQFLLFTRFDETRESKADLFVSFRMSDGTWSEARNLGALDGTLRGARFPGLSPDQRFVFFVGDGGAWYWVDVSAVTRHRPK